MPLLRAAGAGALRQALLGDVEVLAFGAGLGAGADSIPGAASTTSAGASMTAGLGSITGSSITGGASTRAAGGIGAPDVATHLFPDPDQWITPLGRFMRRTSLDELPQLWSVLVGDMSLVGPRPALFNQDDLMDLRRAAGVDVLRPGITGLAQINGRDELAIPDKVRWEAEYLERRSLGLDLGILFATAFRLSRGVT